MDKFREVVASRVKILLSVCGIFGLFIALTALYSRSIQTNTDTTDFIHGFQIGIFIGLECMILMKVRKLRQALMRHDVLKALYIEENDERKKLISLKSSSISLYIILIGIALAAIIIGFYNVTSSITLIITLIFIALVSLSSKQYFNRKY